MGDLVRDLRYAFRSLRQNRGFSVVAILSLAIGIGANTGVYSIYSTIFHSVRGVENPKDLVLVDPGGNRDAQTSYPEYLDYHDQTAEVFTDLAAYKPNLVLLSRGEQSEMILIEEVTGNYFDLLGVTALLGRVLIAKEDDRPQSAPVVVLNHLCWQRKFSGDAGIIGKSVKLNGHVFTVVGIAPSDFQGMFPFHVDLWIPIHKHALVASTTDELMSRDRSDWFMMGRLRAGVSLSQARALVRTIGSRLAAADPGDRRVGTGTVLPKSQLAIIPEIDQPIRLLSWFLMGLVGLVILVAATNLASILLARATARRREIGIRLALGAGRWRLIRQMLVESLLLSLLGGAAGLFIAQGLIQVLLAIRPPLPLEINLRFGLNPQALLFALVLSLGTGIAFGLLPARRATNPNLVADIRGGVQNEGSLFRRLGMQHCLVVAQVAVSSILLLCAGLFLHSLSRAATVDPGFDLRQGILLEMPLERSAFKQEQVLAAVKELQSRFASLPGVQAATVTGHLPLDFGSESSFVFPIGSAEPVGRRGILISSAQVGPDYFRAMGIALHKGREFSQSDLPGSPMVAVVNQAFAKKFWPGEDPLGKQFRLQADSNAKPYTVIGLAHDGKYGTLGENQQAFVYRAYFQRASQNLSPTFVLRSAVNPDSLIPAIRKEIRAVSPDLPVFNLRTVPEYLNTGLFIPTLVGGLASMLGLVALLLGVTGLYGLVALDVARRTREVGIRMALGSTRRAVLALFLRQGVMLVAPGLSIGLLLAAFVSKGLSALLIGVSPLDPLSFTAVPLVLFAVAVAATLVPARRAARLDPSRALRQD